MEKLNNKKLYPNFWLQRFKDKSLITYEIELIGQCRKVEASILAHSSERSLSVVSNADDFKNFVFPHYQGRILPCKISKNLKCDGFICVYKGKHNTKPVHSFSLVDVILTEIISHQSVIIECRHFNSLPLKPWILFA